ncbi:peptidase A4 family-domain-containing protein [Xylariomycetidae sp. FL0641]|nr:peptidase A4 family-domain-containing protein [Xylariomycetidae sp. FL0641]
MLQLRSFLVFLSLIRASLEVPTRGTRLVSRQGRGHRINSPDQGAFVTSFLAGSLIQVDQTSPDQPAVYSVSSDFNVAYLQTNPGVNYSNPANQLWFSQWVGINGADCKVNAYPLLQAGTDTVMNETGHSVSLAWVEWLPAISDYLAPENMTVKPGDMMRVTVTAYTNITGAVTMINLSTGQNWTGPVDSKTPDDVTTQICLGQGNAEYMTEIVHRGNGNGNGNNNPLVFNNITFANVGAVTRARARVDMGGGGPVAAAAANASASATQWWNTTDASGTVAVAEPRDARSFRVYSPKGKAWMPVQGGYRRRTVL